MIFSTRSRIIIAEQYARRMDLMEPGRHAPRGAGCLMRCAAAPRARKSSMQSCLAPNRFAAEMPATRSDFDRSIAAEGKAFVMTKKLIGLVAMMAVMGSSATLFAQEGTKPANVGEGTLMLKRKNYPLKNAARV